MPQCWKIYFIVEVFGSHLEFRINRISTRIDYVQSFICITFKFGIFFNDNIARNILLSSKKRIGIHQRLDLELFVNLCLEYRAKKR